ncbi:uncharacterized protein A4U43_C01F30020 [Asparagus officinalis]|uniref:Uncharacterized protein n=1 Tax=Asparagus officinalis TaxID=4686 RepID=A0A5P1FVK4_ASPOF|nr:uncharacterized protein A4U43_C01F30020 [Asparagus officinalis]
MQKSAGDEMVVYKENLDAQVEEEEDVKAEREPVWVDEEEKAEINIFKHAKLNPGTEWAQIDRKANNVVDSDSESGVTVGDDVLRYNDELVVKSDVKLLPALLEYSRLMDANGEEPSNGPINSIHFHRNGQLLLTAGLDKNLRFFQVDGKRNTKVQSMFIEDCPIHKASFLPRWFSGDLSGRRKFFYTSDLVKSAVDKIGPLRVERRRVHKCLRTKELIWTLKMNGTARSLAFVDGGQQLMSSGGDGTFFAAGSNSGIVNIYKREEFLGAICSNMKKNSLKLVHIPSFSVFSNWPAPRFSLQYPRCLDFSPGGGFMAFGNAVGKVLLHKLHHYQKA